MTVIVPCRAQCAADCGKGAALRAAADVEAELSLACAMDPRGVPYRVRVPPPRPEQESIPAGAEVQREALRASARIPAIRHR